MTCYPTLQIYLGNSAAGYDGDFSDFTQVVLIPDRTPEMTIWYVVTPGLSESFRYVAMQRQESTDTDSVLEIFELEVYSQV